MLQRPWTAHVFSASALWLGVQTPSADCFPRLPEVPSLPAAGHASLAELPARKYTVLSLAASTCTDIAISILHAVARP